MRFLIGRGDAHNNLGHYAEGVADFDHALALDPKNDEAMNDRAWALVHMGRLVEAIKGYDAALAVATTLRGMILGNRCEAKAMVGDIDAALADCDAAVASEPGKVEPLLARGFAKLKGNRFSAAIEDYDAALRIDPTDAFSLFERGVARMALGQNEAGRSDIAAAERLAPTVREKLEKLGVMAPR